MPTVPTPPEDEIRRWEALGLISPGTARPRPARPLAKTAGPPPPAPVPVRLVVGPITVRLASEANARGRLRDKIARKSVVKDAVRAALAGITPPPLPVVVRITRVGGKRLDGDNAVRACKAVRDEVAKWLGCDDADPRARWVVRQRAGYVCGVTIDVRTVC